MVIGSNPLFLTHFPIFEFLVFVPEIGITPKFFDLLSKTVKAMADRKR